MLGFDFESMIGIKYITNDQCEPEIGFASLLLKIYKCSEMPIHFYPNPNNKCEIELEKIAYI